jgi:flagellar basal-body rod protein FlgB
MGPGASAPAAGEALYRPSRQPSLDGNTVDVTVEQTAFMENAVRYQASLEFLGGRIRTLMSAIRGE